MCVIDWDTYQQRDVGMWMMLVVTRELIIFIVVEEMHMLVYSTRKRIMGPVLERRLN